MKPRKKATTARRAPGGFRPLSQPEQDYIMTFAKVAPVKQLASELRVSESAVYRVIRNKTRARIQAKHDLNRFLKSLQSDTVQCKVLREGELLRRIQLPYSLQKVAA